MTKEYVAGFLFDSEKQFVALVQKNKPEWQAGKLNGIGGKIEPGETPMQAMVREFEEETGVHYEAWTYYTKLYGPGFTVYFFYGVSDRMFEVTTTTDEQILVKNISELDRTIPNLRWLIPMALSMDDDAADHFEIQEKQAA